MTPDLRSFPACQTRQDTKQDVHTQTDTQHCQQTNFQQAGLTLTRCPWFSGLHLVIFLTNVFFIYTHTTVVLHKSIQLPAGELPVVSGAPPYTSSPPSTHHVSNNKTDTLPPPLPLKTSSPHLGAPPKTGREPETPPASRKIRLPTPASRLLHPPCLSRAAESRPPCPRP